MFQKVLLIELLLLHYVAQSQPETIARCREDAQMICPVAGIESLNFYSITWYKLSETKQSIGIIRSTEKKTTLLKNYNRLPEPRFGENYSLLLPSVTPEDQGTYECVIDANVGGQNRNVPTHLKVHECLSLPEAVTVTTDSPNKQEDLPAWWSIVGCTAVGLAKIALALISVWVIEGIRKRSSRRRRHER